MSNTTHESAVLHVSGEAVYIDDIPAQDKHLKGFVFYSPYAKSKIKSFNTNKARNVEGVYAILSAKDIPGCNQMGAVIKDEPILADSETSFVGQAIFLVAAKSEAAAKKAMELIEIDFEEQKPILSIKEAINENSLLQPPRKIECGDVDKAFDEAANIIEGEFNSGAQEHWYLETQVSLCMPHENNEYKVYSSTQNPTETQHLVAESLNVPLNHVEVETRRMGGAFGGKETQANMVAIWASLLAAKTRHPVKMCLFRDDDQKITGKRHPFYTKYKVAFDKQGKLTALDVHLFENGGSATDLSMAILERAMMHIDNSYFIPNVRVIGMALKTNLPSNTAFRGFGGPQAMAVIENIIDRIARKLKKDAADIRQMNFYGSDDRNITPYGQVVDQPRLEIIRNQLIESSSYYNKRKAIDEFNKTNAFTKRGLALSPVKFGISFTTSFLNQAGALVNIYKDGTVLVNHGGTEMGQGLHTKIAQIAALELGVPYKKIKVNATNTAKVPNTSPTAASSGTDLNGMAVKNATGKIKQRLIPLVGKLLKEKNAAYHFNEDNIIFCNGFVFDNSNPELKISFEELIPKAWMEQISLSATGFYKTPDIHFDRETGQGVPFYYFAYGMAVCEVEIDTLTGNFEILSTDILHDCGETINPAIDLGQVEGGFVQGVGWCTCEEIKWDGKGRILNHSPDTYKIPTADMIPKVFNIKLLKGAPNIKAVRKSKAVGEPPFMLALSCWLAIKDAISACGNNKYEPHLVIPATNENILCAIEAVNKQAKSDSK